MTASRIHWWNAACVAGYIVNAYWLLVSIGAGEWVFSAIHTAAMLALLGAMDAAKSADTPAEIA